MPQSKVRLWEGVVGAKMGDREGGDCNWLRREGGLHSEVAEALTAQAAEQGRGQEVRRE